MKGFGAPFTREAQKVAPRVLHLCDAFSVVWKTFLHEQRTPGEFQMEEWLGPFPSFTTKGRIRERGVSWGGGMFWPIDFRTSSLHSHVEFVRLSV